jgi:hypothetical protein
MVVWGTGRVPARCSGSCWIAVPRNARSSLAHTSIQPRLWDIIFVSLTVGTLTAEKTNIAGQMEKRLLFSQLVRQPKNAREPAVSEAVLAGHFDDGGAFVSCFFVSPG